MLAVIKDKYFPMQHLLHLKILYSRINLKVPFKKIINNLSLKTVLKTFCCMNRTDTKVKFAMVILTKSAFHV